MRSTEFAFWLQGFFELSETETLSPKQAKIVKQHLALVFKYEIDPSYSDDPKVQQELQDIHDGKTDTSATENSSDNILYRC